nr:MAG TPA_asm: hypothetical protein [Caudoviricetes sp.]
MLFLISSYIIKKYLKKKKGVIQCLYINLMY